MAGKVISRANMARIQQSHDHMAALGASCGPAAKRLALKAVGGGAFELIDRAREAMYQAVSMAEAQDYETYPHLEDIYPDDNYAIIEIGDLYWKAPYVVAQDGALTFAARDQWVQVVEVWQPASQVMKAGGLASAEAATVYATMKALGDRQIEVKVAYGRDAHGEFFSPRTDFDPENFPAPPLLYYHGFDEHGRKQAKPVVTGRCLSRRAEPDGHVLVYQLKSGAYADKQWSAALAGNCVVSPGTVGHLIRKEPSGELLYWPLAEVSAWDGAPNRKQANPRSVAAPVLKALYLAEGLTPPPVLDAPEAPGEGAGAAPDIDPATAGQVIAAEVAKALLILRTKETPK